MDNKIKSKYLDQDKKESKPNTATKMPPKAMKAGGKLKGKSKYC